MSSHALWLLRPQMILPHHVKNIIFMAMARVAASAMNIKPRFYTDKSAKLLFQFGQNIGRALNRLSRQPAVNKPAEPVGGSANYEGWDDICVLWNELEKCLARPDQEGGGLGPAVDLIRTFTGFSWAFLTVILPMDKKNYYLVGQAGDVPDGLISKLPLASGLAGWVHTRLRPLALDKIKADGRHSYIFHKDEPLKKVGSFYGWPLLYQDQSRGALVLAGRHGEVMSKERLGLLECYSLRLAAHLQLDRLIARVMDLSRLDSQTGLPHRGYFMVRLARLMELADINKSEVELFVLATSGLGEFASQNGQAAADGLLHSIAKQLVETAKPAWATGHLSYGVFGLAVPKSDAPEARRIIARFQKQLSDWPLPDRSGRADLDLYLAHGVYPNDASGPEQLLEMTLAALADGEPEVETFPAS